ncbi:phosphatase PAP2 family protein [Streptomyces candidus]|uniref:Undecaprenyl-diphosphatase n=1 Tax=Streptomyces candidus TaxID=67283 RepID=A0A7X0HME5_9ACTN|nr:phosphatase PAP2 family protein [Streptomyces candidus]MBB6438818.1 undecaprenyl-diphosphatase [Streptomyces candidus]
MTGRQAPTVLPPSLRTPLLLIAALAALMVVALGIRYAGHTLPDRVDEWIRSAVDGVQPPWRQIVLSTDFLGEPIGAAALVVAAVAGCLLLGRPRAAVLVVLGPGLAVAATRLLKPLVGRTIHDVHLSYPSGHTAFLTAFALALVLLAVGRPGLGTATGTLLVLAAAVVAGAVMGWAQVALAAHYPTDVLGGWGTALAVTPASAWLIDGTAHRHAARTADAGRPAQPR